MVQGGGENRGLGETLIPYVLSEYQQTGLYALGKGREDSSQTAKRKDLQMWMAVGTACVCSVSLSQEKHMKQTAGKKKSVKRNVK